MKQKRYSTRWAALLLLLLLAFALRLYDLQGQSLWSDEGLTLYRSGQSLAGVLANEIVVDGVATQDASPPLYFLLLGGWRQLAGETVFALRFLGVLLALPAVALLYFLGRTAFGQVAGVAAALLLTLSPFHVWQSQVLRNYGFLLTLNLLSVSALLRFLTLPPVAVRRRRWLLLWGASALAGAYTHYFAFLILAFSLLALVVAGASASARSQNGTRFLRRPWFWGGLLLAGVLLIPVVSVALSRFLAGRQIDFHPVAARTLLVHGLSAFGVGMSRSLSHPWWLYLPAALLALAGLLLAWRRKPAATWFLLGYQFVPLGLLLLLSQVNPLYNGTRHLLIGLPPFLLFLAAAITVPYWRDRDARSARPRWRRLALTAGGLFLAGQVAWLSVQFHDPDFRRDDIQGVAQYLNQVAQPDDLVILHDTLIAFTFEYYYKGEAPVLAIPRYDQHNQDEAVAALAAAGERGERLWFLTKPAPRTGFPRELLSDWAEAEWPQFMEKPFSWIWLPVHLEGFTPAPARSQVPGGTSPLDASFGEAVHLQAVRMPAAQQAGDPWILTFYLSRLQPEQQPYSLVFRLVDDKGTEWARLGRLLWHDYPPAAWPQDTLLRYDHVERIPAGVPPGTYQVWLRVVDEASEPLPLPGGQLELRLPDLTVAAAPCTAEPDTWLPHRPRRARFGPALTLVGNSPLPDSVRPGHRLSLQFLWCVRGQPSDDYRLRLQLLDGAGAVVAESLSSFSRAGLPVTMLQPGTLIAGHADLTVPATVAADTHRLRLSLLPADGDRALPVNSWLSGRGLTLGEVEILPWPLETAFPPIPTPLRADFGVPTLIEFHGYAVEDGPLAAGKETTLTLFWRAATPIPDNYRVFIHLAAEDDQIPAQADGFPVQGMRPTTGWRPGEVIVDEHALSLPATLPPGTYRLWMGLYDLESDVRLPITVDGEAQAGDRLLLETVVIEP